MIDPPIDDESYRVEAHSIPSTEQKHLMYAAYFLTIATSRMFETLSILLVALTFNESLVYITLYSLAVLLASLFNEKLVFFILGCFKSKLFLVKFSFLLSLVSVFLFVLGVAVGRINLLCRFLLLVLSTPILKLGSLLFITAFKSDWLTVLSNSQQAVKSEFLMNTNTLNVLLSLLLPLLAGFLLSAVGVRGSLKVGGGVVVLGVLVQLALFERLYSTCFALHLERQSYSVDLNSEELPLLGVFTPTSATSHWGVPLTSRPISRIIALARKKPVPVLVTFGVQLVNVSLLCVGPHMVWFLLRGNISPFTVGSLRTFQTLVTLHPQSSAPRSFVLTLLGAVLSCVTLGLNKFFNKNTLKLFMLCVVLARSGVPTINLVGEQFVEEYLNDDEVFRLYRENAVWLSTQCEILVHVLTLVWSTYDEFFYPVLVSALMMFIGVIIILRVIKTQFDLR